MSCLQVLLQMIGVLSADLTQLVRKSLYVGECEFVVSALNLE